MERKKIWLEVLQLQKDLEVEHKPPQYFLTLSLSPVRTVIAIRDLLLSEVDEAGVGEDGHGDDDEEEAELLVGLLEGVEQGLEAGKVSDQLEDPEDPHHSHQPDHLPRLPDDLEVLQALQQQ